MTDIIKNSSTTTTPIPSLNKNEHNNINNEKNVENVERLFETKKSIDSNKLKKQIADLEIIVNDDKTKSNVDINNYEDIKTNLIELYEDFKKYFLLDEVVKSLRKIVKEDNERNPILMIKYMGNIIRTLYTIRNSDACLPTSATVTATTSSAYYTPYTDLNESDKDYEILLQKAEKEIIMSHRVQLQLKLVINTLQDKCEELEKKDKIICEKTNVLLKDVKQDNLKLVEALKQKEADFNVLLKLIKQKDEMIKSYEERLLTITILEHKLVLLKERHKKEKEMIKTHYETEFQNLNKEIQQLHGILTMNLAQEEKIQFLQKELASYKTYNIKKIHILEEKLKNLEEFEKTERDELNPGTSNGDAETNTDFQFSQSKSNRADSMSKTSISLTLSPRLKKRSVSSKAVSSLNKIVKPISDPRTSLNRRDFISKKKNQLVEEIGILSMARVKDSEQALKEPFYSSKRPKYMQNTCEYLETKLDKLQVYTEKEKEFLRTIQPKINTANTLTSTTEENKSIPSQINLQKISKSLENDNKSTLSARDSLIKKTSLKTINVNSGKTFHFISAKKVKLTGV